MVEFNASATVVLEILEVQLQSKDLSLKVNWDKIVVKMLSQNSWKKLQKTN